MDCFDRDRKAEKLWRYFKEGRNVLMLMLAPRRMGKTVLLERLKEEGASQSPPPRVIHIRLA